MKTKEQFLRESFGEIEISQIISKYPSSVQRPSIYRAMEEYASQQTAEKDREIARLNELVDFKNSALDDCVKDCLQYAKDLKELSDFKALVKQMRDTFNKFEQDCKPETATELSRLNTQVDNYLQE